jgi:hypothetical protein
LISDIHVEEDNKASVAPSNVDNAVEFVGGFVALHQQRCDVVCIRLLENVPLQSRQGVTLIELKGPSKSPFQSISAKRCSQVARSVVSRFNKVVNNDAPSVAFPRIIDFRSVLLWLRVK